MEIIKTYVDSLFAHYDPSPATQELKTEILLSMEDKYLDLIDQGMSEHEAVGKVISEFGNIDELVKEFELEAHSRDRSTDHPILSQESISHYIESRTKASLLTAIGVFLTIASSAAFMILEALLGENSLLAESIGTSIIIFSILIAVCLFVLANQSSKRIPQIKDGQFRIRPHIRQELEARLTHAQESNNIALIVGLALIFLPIIPIIIIDNMDLPAALSDFTVSFLLICIAIAVFLFVYFNSMVSIYKTLLTNHLSTKADPNEAVHFKKTQRTNKIFETIYWPAVTVIYLIWSFSSGKWFISWIIFVIASIIENIIRQLLKVPEEE